VTHTLLIVEDEADLREMLRDYLELHGFQVMAAGDGGEALSLISSVEHLCLVILDLIMPGMNGWDFFSQLKSSPALSATPVIVATSVPSRAPPGAVAVLRKPLDPDKLLALVRKYCAA
jgi:CheY-like chemotaxis protein